MCACRDCERRERGDGWERKRCDKEPERGGCEAVDGPALRAQADWEHLP
jgi:hypothetical protein